MTNANKLDYLRLLIAHHTVNRFGPQAALIRAGLLTVIPALVLGLFSAGDLATLVTGLVDISVEEWRGNSVMPGLGQGQGQGLHSNFWDDQDNSAGGSASAGAPESEPIQIRWFWALCADLTPEQRGLLLRFCTGCSRLGPGGFQSLEPKFSISLVPYVPSRCLPTAATCFNLLKLPLYPDEKTLRKNVVTATLYGSEGFAFS